jgi:hypothetical protein
MRPWRWQSPAEPAVGMVTIGLSLTQPKGIPYPSINSYGSRGRGRLATRKKLLVTGCGRSGTKYISFLLRRLGYDVGHEKMRRDGAASWCMAVDSDEAPWGEGSRDYCFDQVFHQVRHPAVTIASLTTFSPVSWEFIAKHVPVDPTAPVLLRAANYWYHWNIAAEAVSGWRYRIEDFGGIYDDFCARLGVRPDRNKLAAVEPIVNTRYRGRQFHIYEELCERLRIPVSRRVGAAVSQRVQHEWTAESAWATLEAEHPALFELICRKASDYGYAL